jgi:hypothetical protein
MVKAEKKITTGTNQASFDHESKRPSAKCWRWGKGKVRYTGLLFLPKNRSGSGEVISAGTFLAKRNS